MINQQRSEGVAQVVTPSSSLHNLTNWGLGNIHPVPRQSHGGRKLLLPRLNVIVYQLKYHNVGLGLGR